MILGYCDTKGKRLFFPEAVELLENAPPSDNVEGETVLFVTLWETDHFDILPEWAWVKVVKVTMNPSSKNSEVFYCIDTERGIDDYCPKRILSKARAVLEGFDGTKILQHLSEVFQISGFSLRNSSSVLNDIYSYEIEANIEFPDCYEDVGRRPPSTNVGLHASGDNPADAAAYLAQKIHMFCYPFYLRSADAFQVWPFTTEYRGKRVARCDRCGREINSDLTDDDNYWLCPNEHCPYHTVKQGTKID